MVKSLRRGYFPFREGLLHAPTVREERVAVSALRSVWPALRSRGCGLTPERIRQTATLGVETFFTSRFHRATILLTRQDLQVLKPHQVSHGAPCLALLPFLVALSVLCPGLETWPLVSALSQWDLACSVSKCNLRPCLAQRSFNSLEALSGFAKSNMSWLARLPGCHFCGCPNRARCIRSRFSSHDWKSLTANIQHCLACPA